MIVSFKDNETEKIWNGDRSKRLPLEIHKVARRKLRMINNAQNISDLKIPPANQLEKLKRNYAGLFCIRINDQWRIVFAWDKANARDVQIIDYH